MRIRDIIDIVESAESDWLFVGPPREESVMWNGITWVFIERVLGNKLQVRMWLRDDGHWSPYSFVVARDHELVQFKKIEVSPPNPPRVNPPPNDPQWARF
jgi:hypothetical protein